MQQLTDRQRDVLGFITFELSQHGRTPSLRAIASYFGFASPNSSTNYINALITKGYLERAQISEHRSAVRLTTAYQRIVEGLPIKGQVSAGMMIEAIEQHDHFATCIHPDSFLLRVSGDSMIDAGINDRDLIIVQPQQTADPGQITVVRNDEGESTVKFWQPESDHVRLVPANADYPTTIIAEPQIVGVVVGVMRMM